MTSRSEMSVVGTYPSVDEAERARGHLNERGVEPVEIEQVSGGAWQIEAPVDRRDDAMRELQHMEQQAVRRFF